MKSILIRNATIIAMTGEKPFTGSVTVMGDRIASITKGESDAKATADVEVIEGHGRIVMPGLINTHCHVPMTLMRGYADDIPLMKWLNERVWPFEAKMTPDDMRLGAELGIAEMLLGGVTSFVDMYFHEDVIAQVVADTGIRGFLGSCFFDSNFAEFERDLDALVRFAYTPAAGGRVTPLVGAHSPYTCSPASIGRAMELCDRHGIGAMIHLSETLDEQQIVRERYGCTPAEHLDNLGVFDRQTLAVHCVHVSPSDIRLLADRGISVSHNPQSNMKIASGTAPVAAMIDAGVNMAIGTDGTCSNNDLDVWDEIRSASFLAKLANADPCVLPAYQALEMATCNGARALGMAAEIGQLREGMKADIIVIDGEKPHLYLRHDVVANLVYCGRPSDVETVIVDGRVVVRGRQLVRNNLPSILAAAEKRAHGIAASIRS